MSRSLRKTLRRNRFHLAVDTNFEAVMRNCAQLRGDGLGTWIGDVSPLERDIAGFASEGEPVSLHLDVEPALNGTLLTTVGVFHKPDGTTHEALRQVWGIDGGEHNLQQWFYGHDGMTLNGVVTLEADRIIVSYAGKTTPQGGPLQIVAQQLGLDELEYSAEAVYRVIDEDSFSLIIRNVRVGGQPFDWPGTGTEHVYHRADADRG